MGRLQECRWCRALLTPEQRGSPGLICPYCGKPFDEPLDADNPYAPPESDERPVAWPIEVPRDFAGKLRLAGGLFVGQLPLLAALVLTVSLPANLVIEYIDASNPNPNLDNAMAIYQLRNLVELVFGPIPVAAIITALAARMSGEWIGYAEAIGAGLHHWGRLFWARLVTSLIIGLGLIALVVPGIILAMRFCLIDEVVVVEGEGSRASRQRSTALTRGRYVPIFLVGVLFVATVLTCTVLSDLAIRASGLDGQPWLTAVALCVVDVLEVYFTCLFFLIYWEARQDESALEPGALEWLAPEAKEAADEERG
jgi:hypothetical protein